MNQTMPRPDFSTRYEHHFGNRVIRCYRDRLHSVLTSFQQAAQRAPESECIVCDDQRLSYREVSDRVETMARQLAARGLQGGDRAAILLGNSPEYLLGVLAILRIGAIVVPMNVREQSTGLAYMLNHSEARVVICDAGQAHKIPAPEKVPALQHRFAVGGDYPGTVPFQTLLEPIGGDLPVPPENEEDPAVILYTSGTTGTPKGVILTHLNIIHTLMHYHDVMSLQEGERTLLIAPVSHVTGLVANVLTIFHVAGCVVIIRQFDAVEAIRLIAREKVSHGVMVPAMYNLCLLRTNFEDYDLSHWRVGGFGGAPMPESTIAGLRQKVPALELINAYGATETTSPTTCLPLGDAGRHADSVGLVVPCGELRIMDDNGREVATGESGELWISGPMVVPGYWNNPEANEREFTAGHWRSGDIGSIDAEGYVRVFDRKKDMINRGGYNVYSVELENLIISHPDVVECAIVPHPDPVLGEKIHAFVTRRDDQDLDADVVRAFCREHLADYKIPDYVTIQDEPLPRNANGKLVKAELKGRIGE